MTNTVSNEKMESLSEEIKAQAKYFRQNVFLSFVYTADILNKYLEIQMRKYGAKPIRFNILTNLVTHGGKMKPTDLSKRVFRSKTTLTRVIDGLEKDGLVRREPIGEDRRIREVAITLEGVKLVEETMTGREEITNMAMSCLNKEQTNQLGAILKLFRKHLLTQIINSSNKR